MSIGVELLRASAKSDGLGIDSRAKAKAWLGLES